MWPRDLLKPKREFYTKKHEADEWNHFKTALTGSYKRQTYQGVVHQWFAWISWERCLVFNKLDLQKFLEKRTGWGRRAFQDRSKVLNHVIVLGHAGIKMLPALTLTVARGNNSFYILRKYISRFKNWTHFLAVLFYIYVEDNYSLDLEKKWQIKNLCSKFALIFRFHELEACEIRTMLHFLLLRCHCQVLNAWLWDVNEVIVSAK